MARVHIIIGLVIATAMALPVTAQQAEPSLEEVVITARKREERLQDVPLAVTALSAGMLEQSGTFDTQDLGKQVPGLYYSSFAPAVPNLYVRGVGTRNYDSGSEASVGTFVDGVYMARFDSQIQDLAGVERVEVLRGPQGALFGRNTIGGAINIITRKPDDEFRADASASYGQSSHFGSEQSDISAVVSGPLAADRLFGLISYSRRDDDGTTRIAGTDRLGNGGGNQTGRVRFVLRPTAGDLEFDLGADKFKSFSGNWIWTSSTVGGTRPGIFLGNAFATSPVDPDPYVTSVTPGYGAISRGGWGVNGTITDTIGNVLLTSISAYRESENSFNNDLDGTGANSAANPASESGSQFSQELRLASKPGAALTFGGRVSWLVGGYYFRESAGRQDQIVLGPDSFVFSVYHQTFGAQVATRSWAAFSQVAVDLTSRWHMDLGIRSGHDDKQALLTASEDVPGLSLTPYSLQPQGKWSSVDPSVALSYHPVQDFMVFASYSKGFKSGAFQFLATDPIDAAQIARPESLRAYQAGMRADWLNGRLRTNLSAFQYDYSDLQVPRIEVSGITAHIRTTNAAASTIKGFELEGFAKLSNHLRLDYGYAFLDAIYDNYVYSSTPLIDFTGNRLPRSPRNSANAALSFDSPTPFGDVTARVSGNYTDKLYFESDNGTLSPGVGEPAHTTYDASVGLKRGSLSVTLWGRNLTDKAYRATVLNFPTPSRLLEIWAPRRAVGVTLTWRFQDGHRK